MTQTRIAGKCLWLATLACGAWLSLSASALAHPLVENAMDVVIGKDRVTVDARIAAEEIVLVESAVGRTSTDKEWQSAVERHAQYVQSHIHVRVNGREIAGCAEFVANSSAGTADDAANLPMVPYRWTCLLTGPPRIVEIEQDFLDDFPPWKATFTLRSRRADQSQFNLSLLDRDKAASIACDWSNAVAPATHASIQTAVEVWPTFQAYALHGIEHILTGYDHLLFVTALVLAAGRFWELVKVVTAFTLAHTITLTLAVFNIVTIRSAIVEPMIAASIIFVAVQNIFWPERSTGWGRLAVAFCFGLFHGLGFAGGLKDAMAGMPSVALWVALLAFSLGVEIGHQIVVIPLYSVLRGMTSCRSNRPRVPLRSQVLKFGSAGITLAGIYFLFTAIS